MGTVASNAMEYGAMLIPDREMLQQWGLVGPEDNTGAQMKAAEKDNRRVMKKMFKEVKPMFKAMNMKERDLQAYWDAYVDVDIDGIKSVSYMNFCEFFHFTPSPFLVNMFFDFDATKNMTWQQFVVATFYFGIAKPKDLAVMIFSVYDRGRTGRLYPQMVMLLLRDMYGKAFRLEPDATMAVVKLINTKGREWGVTEEQFVEIMYQHLSPCIAIQRDIKKGIFNMPFWRRGTKHPPLVPYSEAWKMQKEIEDKHKEEARLAAEMALYRSRGGEWKEGAPVPAQILAQREQDATKTGGASRAAELASPTKTGGGKVETKIRRLGAHKKVLPKVTSLVATHRSIPVFHPATRTHLLTR